MAQAVTHVLIAIILVAIYRDYYAKPKFSNFYILLAGFAGLLPDLDYPLHLMFPQYFYHGQFHIMFVPMILVLATIFLYALKSDRKYYLASEILALGYILHFALDCMGGGYDYFAILPIMNYCPQLIAQKFWPAADAIILMLWLCYEYYGHKIREFF